MTDDPDIADKTSPPHHRAPVARGGEGIGGCAPFLDHQSYSHRGKPGGDYMLIISCAQKYKFLYYQVSGNVILYELCDRIGGAYRTRTDDFHTASVAL